MTDPAFTLVSPAIVTDDIAPSIPLVLGVMASGTGSNFEAIASAIANGSLNAKIAVLIYNNPDIKAVEIARRYGIDAVLLNHREFPSRTELDRAIVLALKEYGVECVVMAGWMRVVTSVLIDAFPDRIINIHPSLLPSFPGIRAIEQALAAGVKIAGCTVHIVAPEVDSGPILVQAAVPVLVDDTLATLHARIQHQEHQILPQAIATIARNIQR
jgi:phosphoribosylglycinamide formyltransferase 1